MHYFFTLGAAFIFRTSFTHRKLSKTKESTNLKLNLIMAQRILGLDLGTNSIGWAVVEKDDGKFSLVDKGVRIFQEGVNKNNEPQ